MAAAWIGCIALYEKQVLKKPPAGLEFGQFCGQGQLALTFKQILKGIAASMQGTKATDI